MKEATLSVSGTGPTVRSATVESWNQERVLLAAFSIIALKIALLLKLTLQPKNRLRHFDPIGTEFVSEAGAGQPFAFQKAVSSQSSFAGCS
jgi:hypothetical protein